MKKNDIITVEITDITHEGSGVGKYEGMAIFVPLTAVGDIARVKILKLKKNYAFAKSEQIITPSRDRIATDCDVFNRCGGCSLRHISYQSECALKLNRAMQVMHRIGKTDKMPCDILAAQSPDRYRNKTMYPIAADGSLGFYSRHSHRIISCDDCRLQPEDFTAVGRIFTAWVRQYGISVYNEETHSGLLRHLYIRQGKNSGELMVCIVANGDVLPYADELINSLSKQFGEGLKSVVLNTNKKATNVVLGSKNSLLFGREFIYDVLCGVRFRISPHSFYQVNHDMAELLYEKAAEYAEPEDKNILDLYCGAGTIGLSMASRAKNIIGVEIVDAAIKDAKINAADNGIKNARFICADATVAAEQLANEGTQADVVILDPPRKGCDAQLLKTVTDSFRPERIVYVSCDIATLARDTEILENSGYKLIEYTPVDLFPRTVHCECIALLKRCSDINS